MYRLAGLTLVRTLRRTGEIARRVALGALSLQIQRQLWIETQWLDFRWQMSDRLM